MSAEQNAIQHINNYVKPAGEKRISRHGLYHVPGCENLGGSRKIFERIAQAVGGTYAINKRRGYIYL